MDHQLVELDQGVGVVTAAAGAATSNKGNAVVTSESLTTAAAAIYTLTVTDSKIALTSIVMASVQLGTSTTGDPIVTQVTPAAGSVVIKVKNDHATAALNGTIKVSYITFN
jgi:hypothetical protein